MKEADQPMPVVVDAIVSKGLQTSCVSCGPTHSVAIAAGGIYTWGAGPESNLGRSLKKRKYLGTPWSTHSPTPMLVEMPRGLQRLPMWLVAAGASHTVAVSCDGRLFGWGNTDGGRRRVGSLGSVHGGSSTTQPEEDNDEEDNDEEEEVTFEVTFETFETIETIETFEVTFEETFETFEASDDMQPHQ